MVATLSAVPRPASSAPFTCAPSDDAVTCSTLGDFYSATIGGLWSAKDGWATAAGGTPTAFCSFLGLGCDAGGALTSMCVTAARPRPRRAA